jgi:hypothetical protein
MCLTADAPGNTAKVLNTSGLLFIRSSLPVHSRPLETKIKQ